MLSYNEMIKCEQKYAYDNKQMFIEKYKAFIEYLKKVICITFKDNEKQIVSYLKETKDQSFLLDWHISGIHYDGFYIKADDKTLNVISLIAHDSYYDPVLELESEIDNEELLTFFDKEYKQFLKLFIPTYYLEDCKNDLIDERNSLICKISNKFNEVCYDHFRNYFESLCINDVQSFIESKFSLNFTDERRKEFDIEVCKEYNLYREKIAELTKKFNESVKDLK